MKATEYMTEGGLLLTLRSVRPVLVQQGLMALEQEWRARGEQVDPPTYIIKNVAGDEQTFELTEEALADPENPSQERMNRAQWAKYTACQGRLRAAKGEREQVLLLALGVDITIPDDGWQEMQQWVGITIPTNPLDLKVHYLVTVALSQTDLIAVTSQLNILAMGRMVKPEQVEQFQSSLQRAMEERAGEAVDRALEAVRALVDGAEVPGDAVGNEAQPSAESMGQAE